jgi:hypothetical protein
MYLLVPLHEPPIFSSELTVFNQNPETYNIIFFACIQKTIVEKKTGLIYNHSSLSPLLDLVIKFVTVCKKEVS